MGHKTGLWVVLSAFLFVGAFTSTTFSFAYGDSAKDSHPFAVFTSFLQSLKYGQATGNEISEYSKDGATVIHQLQDEIDDLSNRIDSLENPPKIYTTELTPVSDIDCSNRNLAKAFLSGWCPHPDRGIYFIEDSRVKNDSIIAITLLRDFDILDHQNFCGVIEQDSFNFSFNDEKTGKTTMLENLHGFVIKCDHSQLNPNTILRYTIINTEDF